MRVGLATMGGVALASNRPLVGIDSFTALAAAVPADRRAGRPLLVAIDSRRAEPYVQGFDGAGRPFGAGVSADAAALVALIGKAKEWVVAGSGARRVLAMLPEAISSTVVVEIVNEAPIDPAVLASLAVCRATAATVDPPAPLYLRPPDAVPAATIRRAAHATKLAE